MPYIAREFRQMLEPELGHLCARVRSMPDALRSGCVAYISSVLACSILPDNPRWNDLSRVYGVLASVAAEWYRRMVGPYEDEAAQANGDVYPKVTRT
jgi:hypothetical protein